MTSFDFYCFSFGIQRDDHFHFHFHFHCNDKITEKREMRRDETNRIICPISSNRDIGEIDYYQILINEQLELE